MQSRHLRSIGCKIVRSRLALIRILRSDITKPIQHDSRERHSPNLLSAVVEYIAKRLYDGHATTNSSASALDCRLQQLLPSNNNSPFCYNMCILRPPKNSQIRKSFQHARKQKVFRDTSDYRKSTFCYKESSTILYALSKLRMRTQKSCSLCAMSTKLCSQPPSSLDPTHPFRACLSLNSCLRM